MQDIGDKKGLTNQPLNSIEDIGIKEDTEDNLLIQNGKIHQDVNSTNRKEVAQSIGLSEWQSPDQSHTISGGESDFF